MPSKLRCMTPFRFSSCRTRLLFSLSRNLVRSRESVSYRRCDRQECHLTYFPPHQKKHNSDLENSEPRRWRGGRARRRRRRCRRRPRGRSPRHRGRGRDRPGGAAAAPGAGPQPREDHDEVPHEVREGPRPGDKGPADQVRRRGREYGVF